MTREEKLQEIAKVIDFELRHAVYDSVRVPVNTLKAWQDVIRLKNEETVEQ